MDQHEFHAPDTHVLRFLGTCAADFSPRLRTDLADRFDRDARRSSSALLDGRFLIDCGTHTPDSLRIAGIDPGTITDLFVTHTHADHFDPAHVRQLAAANRTGGLRLWISEDAVLPKTENVTVLRMEKYRPCPVAPGVTVTGLKANHDPKAAPQWLLFEIGSKKLLYALDGAWIENETYYYLKNAAADLIVADATVGDYEGDYRAAEHNSIPMLRVLLPSLRTFGVIGDRTRVCLSHIAPSLHRSHAELEMTAASLGALAAYDGMEIRF